MCASVPGSSAETSGVTVAAANAREIIPAAASTQATRCGEDVAVSLPSAVASWIAKSVSVASAARDSRRDHGSRIRSPLPVSLATGTGGPSHRTASPLPRGIR